MTFVTSAIFPQLIDQTVTKHYQLNQRPVCWQLWADGHDEVHYQCKDRLINSLDAMPNVRLILYYI